MGACVLDDGADGPFSYAVEGVNVRRASGLTDGGLVHEFFELVREKFAGVVGMQ